MDRKYFSALHTTAKGTIWCGLCAIVLSTLAGCSSADPEKYVPAANRAEHTLAMVLNAWKSGSTVDQVDGAAVRISDSKRRRGQILKAFEIVGELPSDSGRRFQVKLTLDKPAAEQRVQYLVVGIDPLWVFRQEDYDMMTHWDHPMPTQEAKAEGESKNTTAAARTTK
jgi:hypothetical protein